MTGEHGVYVALVNRGRTDCALDGYPGVALYDTAGVILPFRACPDKTLSGLTDTAAAIALGEPRTKVRRWIKLTSRRDTDPR
jgi:Protein of unknown function (DUF4232)